MLVTSLADAAQARQAPAAEAVRAVALEAAQVQAPVEAAVEKWWNASNRYRATQPPPVPPLKPNDNYDLTSCHPKAS